MLSPPPLPDLILIPTQLEFDSLLAHRGLRAVLERRKFEVQLCGFGPIAAAANTARILGSRPTRRILLAGIAGGYTDALPLGSAWQFERVGCWGVGIGSGSEFRPVSDFGFSQLPAGMASEFPGEVLPLFRDPVLFNVQAAALALTCPASSSNPLDAAARLKRFPTASAEEMEGFGVALACLNHQSHTGQPVQLGMIRGISNRAGERNKAGWKVAPALHAVAELMLPILLRE